MKFFLATRPSSHLQRICHALLSASIAAAALLSQIAHARSEPPDAANTATTAPSTQSDASQPASASAAPASPAAPPRYAAADLKRAFNFMDGNHDGKVSREEASGFRGVAKNFDRADTNHDGFLSREEFDKAMNYVKSKQP
ncbi:MAG: EF-hand domain-containing protein [Polaromonas sp.]